MNLRSGYFARSYGGILRESGAPRFQCDHEHDTEDLAKACSKHALDYKRAYQVLPTGWRKA